MSSDCCVMYDYKGNREFYRQFNDSPMDIPIETV